MFSVIIPTWNEEPWLPALLKMLDSEKSVLEIIVADNSSIDDTQKIARESNCRVVTGGLPAFGRNAGAQIAQGSTLLFIDADVTVTPQIFIALTRELSDPGTNLVYFRMLPIDTNFYINMFYRVADSYSRLCAFLGTHQGAASLICVRKSAYAAVEGFDVTVSAAEDVDFIRRVSRQVGGVRYVRSAPLYVSSRRFYLEGRAGYALKCIAWGLLRLLGFRVSIVPYTWKRYSLNKPDEK